MHPCVLTGHLCNCHDREEKKKKNLIVCTKFTHFISIPNINSVRDIFKSLSNESIKFFPNISHKYVIRAIEIISTSSVLIGCMELNEKSSSSHTRERMKKFSIQFYFLLYLFTSFPKVKGAHARALFTLFNPNLKCFFFLSFPFLILLHLTSYRPCRAAYKFESSWQKKKIVVQSASLQQEMRLFCVRSGRIK